MILVQHCKQVIIKQHRAGWHLWNKSPNVECWSDKRRKDHMLDLSVFFFWFRILSLVGVKGRPTEIMTKEKQKDFSLHPILGEKTDLPSPLRLYYSDGGHRTHYNFTPNTSLMDLAHADAFSAYVMTEQFCVYKWDKHPPRITWEFAVFPIYCCRTVSPLLLLVL